MTTKEQKLTRITVNVFISDEGWNGAFLGIVPEIRPVFNESNDGFVIPARPKRSIGPISPTFVDVPLRPPAELPLELGVVDLDQSRSSVRAAVGHVADEEVFEEFLQLFLMQRVVCFDGVAADGGGDHVFAEAQGGHAVARGANLVDDVVEERLGIVAFQKDGEGVDLEGVASEGLCGKAEFVEGLEVAADEIKIARREVDHDGGEEPLRGHALGFHATFHFLEEDTFVRGVLIHEDETLLSLEEDVELPEYPDEPVVARSGLVIDFGSWLRRGRGRQKGRTQQG